MPINHIYECDRCNITSDTPYELSGKILLEDQSMIHGNPSDDVVDSWNILWRSPFKEAGTGTLITLEWHGKGEEGCKPKAILCLSCHQEFLKIVSDFFGG